MTLRTELEVALGGVQLRAMEIAVQAAAGLKDGNAGRDGKGGKDDKAGNGGKADDGPGIAYLSRPGKKGLPLVGIHGFGGDKETWLLMSALVPRARGITLVDLPGHGRSDDVPEDRCSVRDHAEAVVRVMDRAGVDRAVICGNSMGGGVALRLARSWPSRVAGLVLVGSVGRDLHSGGARQWVHGDNPLIPRLEDVDKFMELALERPPPVGKAVIRHVITERAKRAEPLSRLFRGLVLGDGDRGVPDELSSITVPALVIHGEQDRIIDKRVAEDLVANLPRAELVIMRGVGHVPQLEAPRHTARIVERFARRVDETR